MASVGCDSGLPYENNSLEADMTASIACSGIPRLFTKRGRYYLVRVWFSIQSGYRTVEESDVHTSSFDLFGQRFFEFLELETGC